MKRKKLLTFLAILFSFVIVNGQNNMMIHFVDNSNSSTPLNDIQKITFSSDNMLLKTKNGGENSYLLDNIASVTFLDEIGIRELPEVIDVNFYINVSGEIVVETSHQINKLTVFDLNGRQVAITSQNRLNVNSLTTGVYILQVITDQGTVNKKFIKNR